MASPVVALRLRSSLTRRPAGEAVSAQVLLLPDPPSSVERLLYLERRLTPLMIASVLSFGALIASQILLVRQSPWLLLLIPVFAASWLYYVVSAVVNIGSRSFDLGAHAQLVAAAKTARYRPTVDVFLPVCGEAWPVLANTWRHVARLSHAYAGDVRVHVLDDSPTDRLAAAATEAGFHYLRRPDPGWFKKAGNLRYAYQRTSGELILILDADFAPRTDLLDELTPYFAADPRTGIVQSPQFFRVRPDQGWLERGAGAVQELFYRMIQMSRQRSSAAICVGSCAVYRRAALDSNGGTTLIEHSEDVHTGFDLRRHGWSLRYVPLPLAAGLCPPDVPSFFAQQYRWCAGSLSLLASAKFWTTPLAPRARLSYVSGYLYYLHTAVFVIIGPVLPLVLLIGFPQLITIGNYLLVLPSVIYNMVIFPAWHRCRFGVEAWTTKIISGWAHGWAILDTLRRRRLGWVPTGGVGTGRRASRLWVGLAGWTLPMVVMWVLLAAERMAESRPIDFLPMFLMGAFYLSLTLQSLLVDPTHDSVRAQPTYPAVEAVSESADE